MVVAASLGSMSTRRSARMRSLWSAGDTGRLVSLKPDDRIFFAPRLISLLAEARRFSESRSFSLSDEWRQGILITIHATRDIVTAFAEAFISRNRETPVASRYRAHRAE